MEITSFILGVAAVITILMVVVTFMNFMEIKNLLKDIRNLEQVNKAIWRDLDNRESKLLDYSNKLDGDIRQELENLYRHIDSRVDKLEEKTKKELKYLTSTKSN
jgi:predicted PurR-regulated permease PerM